MGGIEDAPGSGDQQVRLLPGVHGVPLVNRVHLPGHVPEGNAQGEQRIPVYHPILGLERPEPVPGVVVPLLLRAQEETAAQNVGPCRELPVLGGQIHVVGPAAPI